MWLFFMLFGSPAGLLSLASTLTGRSPAETGAGQLPLA
jgi:hypothetical protein